MAATKRKADARQTTMFSALDEYEALDPVIVLWGDDRWADCMQELRTARWHSYDIEGYDGAPQPPRGTRVVVHEDGTAERKKSGGGGRERINIHTFIPRLLQVALPSGRVMIADLGGIRDNREERHAQHAEFLRELAAALYDPERLTIGHHLKFDLAVSLMRYGWRCRGARCTMLMSQLLYAGLRGVRHNLGAVCGRLGIPVKKEQQRSDWTGPLSNAQLNYAGRDPLVTARAAIALGGHLREAGMRKSAEAEMLALPAFVEAEYRGMPVDEKTLRELLALWRGIRALVVQPFLQRYPGCVPSRNKDVALRLSADPAHEGYKFYTSGTTSTGKTTIQETVGEEVLVQFDTPDRPWIGALMEWRSTGKQVEYLEQFEEKMRDGRIRTEFSQIAGGEDRSGSDKEGRGMGRSGSSAPNLQNSPKLQPAHKKLGGKEVRSVCAPAPGRALLVADLSQAHARIATEASQDPTLLQIYRNGEDTHCHTASALAQLKGLPWTWQDVNKLRKQKTEEGTLAASLRDVSKPTFYGCVPVEGSFALTRAGWRPMDQIGVGAEIMVYDPETKMNVWSPVLAMNVYDDAPVFSVNFGSKWTIACTDDHRWFGTMPKRVPRSKLAAGKPEGMARGEWYKNAMMLVEEFTTLRTMQKAFRIKVSAPAEGGPGLGDWQIPIEKYGVDWEPLILMMTREERRAFLWGCLISEGHITKKMENNGRQVWMLSQRSNELGQAMLLAAYLEGFKIAVHNEDGKNGNVWRMRLCAKEVVTGQQMRKTPLGNMRVWCPTTRTGTWVLRQGNTITITGNSLNLQGPTTLQRTALTSPEPVPMTMEQATEAIQAWRTKYAGLYNYQRATVRAAAQRDIVFGGLHYAEQRTLTNRRLYVLKDPDYYSQAAPTLCAQCGQVHGKLAPKPTDCVSFVWMGTEADAIKRAMGLIHLSFLAHPEWEAFIVNFVHDEIDVECADAHRYVVAAEVQRIIWECMRWAGVVSIPVDDPDAAPCHPDLSRSACDENNVKSRCGRCKMVVKTWADK